MRLALPALLALAACSSGERAGDAPAGTPSPAVPDFADAEWVPPAQCPSWADADRPAGSNCYGIMPESCGADRASAYVGQTMSAAIEEVLEKLAVARLRVIAPDTAYTEDLNPGRLNVFTDASGTITGVDCF
ncbi:I78 family peptidase inhibitor [Croceicoccus bisphenolivorans]|uniref:I78 family peptidase inhibitor n=1 Tax=Croceicoccus bisphenolivorans TaxID=1783232 RepID=UPI00083764F3|nr:I78 family peptidase inhibitor [Croceicoccus bisphenolivorans]